MEEKLNEYGYKDEGVDLLMRISNSEPGAKHPLMQKYKVRNKAQFMRMLNDRAACTGRSEISTVVYDENNDFRELRTKLATSNLTWVSLLSTGCVFVAFGFSDLWQSYCSLPMPQLILQGRVIRLIFSRNRTCHEYIVVPSFLKKFNQYALENSTSGELPLNS